VKLAIILGTRPEIIKMSPVIRECEQKNLDYFILHTGQHYSYNMDRVFFEQLELPEARYNLDVGSGNHGEQTGKILAGIEQVLMKEKPDAVLVQGDTNTVLAGALAASKLHIKVGHVEAGLRSYDHSMPEETNRVLADHCSDYLFAPTKGARNILLGEGIPEDMIYMTGNTIVDAVRQNVKIAAERTSILNELNIEPGHYLLTTAHMQENVDDRARLTGILQGLESLAEEFDMPVDFLSFLELEKNAGLILTDSGGVQEESCILGVPCVTLRDNTERPETVEVGANVLAGTEPEKIVRCARNMIEMGRTWENPLGDGMAGERIRRIMAMSLGNDINN